MSGAPGAESGRVLTERFVSEETGVINATLVTTFTDPVTVLISQNDEHTIHIFAETAAGGLQLQGVVVDTAASEANGRLSALLCGSDVAAGAFSLNGRAENAGGAGGMLRADALGSISGIQPVVYLCGLTATRVMTDDPGVHACGS